MGRVGNVAVGVRGVSSVRVATPLGRQPCPLSRVSHGSGSSRRFAIRGRHQLDSYLGSAARNYPWVMRAGGGFLWLLRFRLPH